MTSLPIYEILTFAIFMLILLVIGTLAVIIIVPLANYVQDRYELRQNRKFLKKVEEKFAPKHTKKK